MSKNNIECNTRQTTYSHIVLTGNAYEVGYQLGEYCKKRSNLLKQMSSPFYGRAKCSQTKLLKVQKLFDQYCPGLLDEIRGFADSTHVTFTDIMMFYSYETIHDVHCSHFAVGTEGKEKLIMGRSYEFVWGEDPLLIETHISGHAASIGFAAQLFGRIDGMNEYGVCVTTAGGNVSKKLTMQGFVFILSVRAILERCRTVEEAIQLLMELPNADARSYIISDTTGKAVLVECIGDKKSYQILSKETDKRYVCEANHFTLPNMEECNANIAMHSRQCYDIMHETIRNHIDSFTVNTAKELLSKPIPHGCCCPSYIEGFGTMWSVIFLPIKKTALICFGSPQYGQWKEFTISEQNKDTDYTVELINEVNTPTFWSMADSDLINDLTTMLSKEKEITAIILDYGYQTDEYFIDHGIPLTVVVTSTKKYRTNYCIDFHGITVFLHVIDVEELKNKNNMVISSFETGYQGVLLYSKNDSFDTYYQKSFCYHKLNQQILLMQYGQKAIELLDCTKTTLQYYVDYTQGYLLLMKLIDLLALIEVNLHDEIPVRATLLQAMTYEPEFFKKICTDIIYDQVDDQTILEVFDTVSKHLFLHANKIFAPVFDYLNKQQCYVGVSEVDQDLKDTYRIEHSLQNVLEWLTINGMIYRGTKTIQLTYGSKYNMEEVAYYYDGGEQ